jgi:hypothetical protein
MFRLRMRRGRAMLTASLDPEREPSTSAGAGDEVLVSEETAAFLMRQRAANVIEIIEPAESDNPPP